MKRLRVTISIAKFDDQYLFWEKYRKINLNLIPISNAVLNVFLLSQVKRTVATLDTDIVEKIKPKSKDNPDNVQRVEFILSEVIFTLET